MRYAHSPASCVSAILDTGSSPTSRAIDDEPGWRVLPRTSPVASSASASSASKVIATRWHAVAETSQEFGAQTAVDRHVVKIVLRNMNLRLSVAGRTVLDGLVTPGMFHVTEPGAPVRGLFRGPFDALHLHIPNSLIAECGRDAHGQESATLVSRPAPTTDPWVESLARALLQANHLGGSFGQFYADCISLAIVARLLAPARSLPERPKVAELARWRLKRALDYVDARLDKPMSLADMSAAAGLTRMHFAAQFRAATGLRPHEYLLRRRIERAQVMLVESDMSLLNVALSVGFQTQSHFTAVFKRFVGQPPRAWRELRRGAACERP
jgi:AraC family transcriptional regulator